MHDAYTLCIFFYKQRTVMLLKKTGKALLISVFLFALSASAQVIFDMNTQNMEVLSETTGIKDEEITELTTGKTMGEEVISLLVAEITEVYFDGVDERIELTNRGGDFS
jgi:hypothetical protein